ncbi:MAG: tetratricopeptide repeat protein [Candidatus Eremiobacteraeota bacterium]|nr:tetratricopeptide repeat protein [Candidatus Eremiobacteraeota bacterium]
MPVRLLPAPPPMLVGREKEIEHFFHHLHKQRIFFIEGTSGIGKTALCLTIADHLERESKTAGKVFWIECYDGWQITTLVKEIKECLSDKEANSGEKANGDSNSLEEKIINLIKLLNHNSHILFIDDFQFVGGEKIEIFFELLQKYMRNSKIIFILNKLPEIPRIKMLDFFEEKIQPLKIQDAIDLIVSTLELHGHREPVQQAILETIVDRVFCYPYLLRMIAATIIEGKFSPKEIADDIPGIADEINEYILKKLLIDFDEEEMDLLGLICIARAPMPHNLVPQKTVLEKLERKFIIQRSIKKTFKAHSIIKNFVVMKMQKEKKSELHEKLAENLAHSEQADIIREAIFHFLEAGDEKQAEDLLSKYGGEICSEGYYEEIVKYSDRLLSDDRSPEKWNSDIVILHANVLSILGKWKESIELLKRFKESARSSEIMGRIYNSIAGAHLNRGQIHEALALYLESLDIHKKNKQHKEEVKALNYITFIYAFRGEVDKALEYANRAFELSKKMGFSSGMAYSLRMQGTALLKNRDFKKALSVSKECEEMAKEMKSIRLQCWAILNESSAYTGLGNYEMADKELERVLEMGISRKDTQIQAFSHLYRGILFHQMGNPDKALSYLKQAVENFQSQGNILGVSVCNYQVGLIALEQGENDKASGILEQVIDVARKNNHHLLEIEAIDKIAPLYIETGEYEKARLVIDREFELLDEFSIARKEEFKCNACLCRGLLTYRRNEVEETEKHIQESLILAYRIKDPLLVLKTDYFAGKIEADLPDSIGESDISDKQEKFLAKLGESQKQEANRYFSFIDKFTREEFIIKTNKGEFIGSKEEAENFLSRKTDFDIFIDVMKQTIYEKTKGEIDISRKRVIGMMFLHFVKNAGGRFSPAQLYKDVWGWDYDEVIHAQEVRKNISRLRNMIEPDRKNPTYIKTATPSLIEKSGYYFDANSNFCCIEKKS